VEFDRHGLRQHNDVSRDGVSLWEQSLVVETVTEAWLEHWDETLSKVSICIKKISSKILFNMKFHSRCASKKFGAKQRTRRTLIIATRSC
jgi:hypothetical protein